MPRKKKHRGGGYLIGSSWDLNADQTSRRKEVTTDRIGKLVAATHASGTPAPHENKGEELRQGRMYPSTKSPAPYPRGRSRKGGGLYRHRGSCGGRTNDKPGKLASPELDLDAGETVISRPLRLAGGCEEFPTNLRASPASPKIDASKKKKGHVGQASGRRGSAHLPKGKEDRTHKNLESAGARLSGMARRRGKILSVQQPKKASRCRLAGKADENQVGGTHVRRYGGQRRMVKKRGERVSSETTS